MSDQTRSPASVWPLASHLIDEMDHRGWTAVDVAARMPGEYTRNVALVNVLLAVQTDKMIIDRSVTEPIAVAFDVSWQFFQNLHDAWKNHPEAREPFQCPEHVLTGMLFPENDDTDREPNS